MIRVRLPGPATLLAVVAVLATTFFAVGEPAAHEVRPAYLELREGPQGEYAVLWKTPSRGGRRLALTPRWSVEPVSHTVTVARTTGQSYVERWRFVSAAPLAGQTVAIDGLSGTLTDALVRIEYADGRGWTQRLTPARPFAVVPERQTVTGVASQYAALGLEHILTGIDHLLFVATLMLITGLGWKLVATVSAFTVSHGFTMTAASLGYVHVPQKPVEALIALSIVFVAAEIVRSLRGHEGLASRAPWTVAFTFGLLHGLGFAGGLSEIGMPESHVPTALLFFSVGVEIGHLAFVAAAAAVAKAARNLVAVGPRWVELVPPYSIGGLAAFWVIERVAAF